MRNMFKYILGGLLVGTIAVAATNRVWESQEWLSGQITTPSNPSAGKFKFYFKSDGDMYKLNSSGVEEQVGGGGSAAEVTFASSGTIVASNVQDALQELDSDIVAHLGDTSDAHDASAISNVASGNISGTTVQAAIDELDSEKATTASVSAKQDSDADLTALAGLASAGLVARTAANTYSERTLTGTANQITVTNGDGVAGNPTVSIPSNPVLPGTGHSVNGISYLTGTDDPTATATSAAAGSLYTNTTTGTIYRKTDAGSSTNWSIIGTSAAITASAAYTPTFTGFGTATSITFSYRQVGDKLEIEGLFTAGTTTATEGRISLPASCTSASDYPTFTTVGTYGRGASTDFHGGMVFVEASKTYLTFSTSSTWSGTSSNALAKANGDAILATGNTMSLKASVRCSGLASVVNTATTPIITAYQSWTPTLVNFGTVGSVSGKYHQVGNEIEFEITWTNGSPVASTVTMTTPGGCVTASDYPTLAVVGHGATSATLAGSYQVLAAPSESVLYFGVQQSAAGGVNKAVGNNFSGSAIMSFKGKVRCAGMPGVIPAPNLVGFNTNNGSSAIREESAKIAGASAGACGVTETGSSDWINGNAVNGSAGVCTFTFNAGMFSTAPECFVQSKEANKDCYISSAETTSGFAFTCYNASTNAAADANGENITCRGPR